MPTVAENRLVERAKKSRSALAGRRHDRWRREATFLSRGLRTTERRVNTVKQLVRTLGRLSRISHAGGELSATMLTCNGASE